jgi:hypothetical protein
MTDAGKGPARGYSWPPVERGQVGAAHIATTHGAYSPALVDPLAAQIVADQLASPSCPPHLAEDPERWRYALDAWGRAEATVRLIRGWLDGQDVGEALSETTTAAETTETTKGKIVKRTVGKRRESALAALDRAERTAAARRNELGLTPMAAARLKLSQDKPFDLAAEIMRLDAEESAGGR